jgi:predicted RNA-binding protein YlxR (DUF448 family)
VALEQGIGHPGKRSRVPERTCILCGTKAPKRELLRVVASSDGSIRLDPEGKVSGRGAYLCRRPECNRDKLKMQRLSHALHTKVTDNDWAALVVSLGVHQNPR